MASNFAEIFISKSNMLNGITVTPQGNLVDQSVAIDGVCTEVGTNAL
jgi:hypothetical protein